MRQPFQVFSFSIKNQANGNAEIHIDGDIVDASTQSILKEWFNDETSTSYKSFRDQVNKLDASVLDVIINSPGGHVGDAMAIHDLLVALQAQGKTVNTIGRGIIASSATLILMAGKKPTMSENSMFMMHSVSGGVYGNVTQVENYAKTMRKFNDKIRDLYSNKSGRTPQAIEQLMDSETWMTAQEAAAYGFVTPTEAVAFQNKIEKDAWPYANQEILNKYNESVQSPSNTEDIMKSIKDIVASLKTDLIAAFTTNKDKGDAAITAAVTAALKPLEELDMEEEIKNEVTAQLKPFMKKLNGKAATQPEDEDEDDDNEEVVEEVVEEEEIEDKDTKGKKKKPLSVEARLKKLEEENTTLKNQVRLKIGNKTQAEGGKTKEKVEPIGNYVNN